jgi:predicted nucleotidyltransferase
MGINEKEIEKIKEYLKEKLSPYLIILFGSAVKGYMREDSDVDIAFLSDKELNSYEVFLIAQGLADLLGRDVDLVDLKKASTVFQVQVISTGKVIFCSDKTKRMVFEMTALKKYARLNEERECILEKIKERGSIYGK